MSFQSLIHRLLLTLPPETAHDIGLKGLRLTGRDGAPEALSQFGDIERFGLKFASPLGVAAGFDKNGVVVDQLAGLGFGFVEVGTVTYEPQPGNPKPRLFRLPEDKALINRLGFNNDGAQVVADRLAKIRRRCVVGVNIGKNKEVPNEEAVENYIAAFELVHSVGDYIAINVSSPNTPGLRELQDAEHLDRLLAALQNCNQPQNKPLLVKIAPDLSTSEIESIIDVCLANAVAGIIATNTTVSRTGLASRDIEKIGSGGVSGRPLATRSNEVISIIYKRTNGRLPIIGVGGIFTAEDAFNKIAAGASLVEAYTGFIYGGPAFAGTVNAELARMLKDGGFNSVDEAVGSAS